MGSLYACGDSEVVGNLANKLGIIIMLVFFLSRIEVFKKLILKKIISCDKSCWRLYSGRASWAPIPVYR